MAERGRWGLLLAEAHSDYKEKRFSNALVKYLLLAELGYEAAQANAGFMLERGEIGYEIFEGWKKLNGNTTDANKTLPNDDETKTHDEEVVADQTQKAEDAETTPPVENPTDEPKKEESVKYSQPKYQYGKPIAIEKRSTKF